MFALIELVLTVIDIYIYIVIGSAVMSWLTAFGVVNRYNRFVAMVEDTLFRLTEPVLQPIRRVLPNFGGIDISPIVLILLLTFIRNLVATDIARLLLH